jgi:hypothetical protein
MTKAQNVLIETETSTELATIEAISRETFNAAVYAAQAAWHNENERLIRAYQDGVEDNGVRYRQALVKAQRNYRDATADRYENAA